MGEPVIYGNCEQLVALPARSDRGFEWQRLQAGVPDHW